MKKKLILVVITLIIFLYIVISTTNFYMGSNSCQFNTPFDDIGSEWYSFEYDIKARVYNDEYVYMILTCKDSKEKYILLSLDNLNLELYKADDVHKALQTSPLCRPDIKIKKWRKKVYRFKLENVTISSKEIEKIVFDKTK